eukprot:scaffold87429_cov73-Phaeocystis_antarctica.AAC.1
MPPTADGLRERQAATVATIVGVPAERSLPTPVSGIAATYARQDGELKPTRLGIEASASCSHCATTSRGITSGWSAPRALGALATRALGALATRAFGAVCSRNS